MKFEVEGMAANGSIRKFIVEADDEDKARRQILEKGCFVTQCHEAPPDMFEAEPPEDPVDGRRYTASQLSIALMGAWLVGVMVGFVAGLLCCR